MTVILRTQSTAYILCGSISSEVARLDEASLVLANMWMAHPVKLGRSQSLVKPSQVNEEPGRARPGQAREAARLSFTDTVQHNPHSYHGYTWIKLLLLQTQAHIEQRKMQPAHHWTFEHEEHRWTMDAKTWPTSTKATLRSRGAYSPRCYLCIFIPNTCVVYRRYPG